MAARAFLVREVAGLGGGAADRLTLSDVGTVAPNSRLRPVQQIGQNSGVVYVGGGGHHRADEFGFTVHPHVGLHPEIPLVSLLGLMHLGAAHFFLVLRRRWRIDDRGIDDGATGDGRSRGRQMCAEQGKDLFAEAVRFQQVAELAHCGLIWGALAPQIDTHKGAHGARVVERLFHGRVFDPEPLLQKIDAQHP